jgi:hypothetical protein
LTLGFLREDAIIHENPCARLARGEKAAPRADLDDSLEREGSNYPPSVKPCRLCSKDSLKSELLLEAFELMMPLNIVRAAEPADDDEDDEDPDTVSDDDEDELP